MGVQPHVGGLEPRADGFPARFTLDFRTRSSTLAGLRRPFGARLASAAVDDDLLLAVTEAVCNSVDHAYPPDVHGAVLVSAHVEADGTVRAVVADRGRWRVPLAALSTRGRGLLLMRENVDQVVVDRTPRGMSVTLRRSPRPRRSGALGVRWHGHEVLVEECGAGVHVSVGGDVPASTGAALRRSLLTAARGGSVSAVVDLGELGAETAGAAHAVFAVAAAASAAGNHVVVLARPGTPAWSALAASGVRHVAAVVSPIG